MAGRGSGRIGKWVGGIAGGLVVLALVAAALVAWVVPGIAIREASKGMEAATGRKLAIGSLSIHPFTWHVEIRDLSLSEKGTPEIFASIRRAEVSVGLSSLWNGSPVIYGVHVEEPYFHVVRTAPNAFNFSDLLKYLEAPVPSLTLEDVAFRRGSIDLDDRALARPERHTVREAELVVPFLTTVPSRASEFGNPRFHAVIDGAPLTIESKVRGLPRAVEASAKVDLKDVSLPVYLSYLPARIPVKVDSGKVALKGTARYRISEEFGGELGWEGTVGVTDIRLAEAGGPARLEVGAVTVRSQVTSGSRRGLRVDDAAIEVKGLAIPFGPPDGLKVVRFAVDGVKFQERANALEVASVLLDGGAVRVSRDRAGRFSPEALADDLSRKMPRTRTPPAPAPPMNLRVARVEGKGIEVAFLDGTRKERPLLVLKDLGFQARDITGPQAGKIPFELSARTGKDTTIQASGWAVPEPLAVDARIELRNVELATAGPYVNEQAQVEIAGGLLDLRLQAALASRDGKMGGTLKGGLGVRSLEVLDRRRGKLVGWKVLSLDGIEASLEPDRVAVSKVLLDGLRVSVVKGKDGKTNLPASEPPADPKGAKPAPRGKPTPIRIDELVVRDGAIDYVDETLPGPFRAPIRDLDVKVTGMSTEPGRQADLDVRMKLPKGAPLTVKGRGAPLKEPATADVHLVIDRLDLTFAQPYANTFLGLDVDRGTLSVDTRAKVAQGTLSAENRIRVDQLTYGKGVKSDKATILPVRLLTDILRDRDGNIVLDLPVTARTDAPDVVGTIVGQVVKDVILPPGSPLTSVTFDACSEVLGDDAQGRLRRLAQALGERPAMRIVAMGYVDPDRDRAACAGRVAAEKAERARAAAAPAGAAGTAPVVAIASRLDGAPPPLPPILEGDARLDQLAGARAQAVQAFLVGPGGVAPPRVAARGAAIGAPSTRRNETGPRVEFAPMDD